METFHVRILASDHPFYEGPCESLTFPAPDGLYGIMAHHSDMVSAVSPGTLTYRLPGESNQIAAVSEGLLKVENNDVLLLVDTIERPEEIDINRAQEELAAAREKVLQQRNIREYRMAQMSMAREMNRLKIKSRTI